MPSPYRHFGRDGGRDCTNTADPTVTTTPWSYEEGQTHCGSYNRKSSREQNAASQAGTHGSGRGLHASGRWADTYKPLPYVLDGAPGDRQHVTQHTHRHGKCPLECSCRDQRGIPGISQEIASGSRCAGPRPLACGRICVGCRKKTGKTTAHTSRGPSHQRTARWTSGQRTTTWRMMKSGQWMELRQDTRPTRTRERRPATGAKAMWRPQNPEWSMIQWLPREQGSNGEVTSTTVQGIGLWGAKTRCKRGPMKREAHGCGPDRTGRT